MKLIRLNLRQKYNKSKHAELSMLSLFLKNKKNRQHSQFGVDALLLRGKGMLRRFSAFIITPIITGLLISLFSILYQGRFNEVFNTVIFVCGMTLVFSLLFGMPPYLWLRWKKRYSGKAIIKTGIVVGGIIGLMVSIVTSQIGIILLGIVFGFIGSLIFHYIHGTVDI